MNVEYSWLSTMRSTTSRRYPRSMHPQSLMRIPVIRRVIAFTIREGIFRKRESFRISRTVPTTSKSPSSIARTMAGISSGGFCRSASIVTTISPRTTEKPDMIAECCP